MRRLCEYIECALKIIGNQSRVASSRCRRRTCHLFAAARESVHRGWNMEWLQPVKLLEDYQLCISVFSFVPVTHFIDNLHDRWSQKQCRGLTCSFIFPFLSPNPNPPPSLSHLTAASSFSFCRASLEHTVSAEELSYQLPRRAGGSNLTWHDGRGQKTAHTRTVKLLQQPGTEGIQVNGCAHGKVGERRGGMARHGRLFKCVLSLQNKWWTRESRRCGAWKPLRRGRAFCIESFQSERPEGPSMHLHPFPRVCSNRKSHCFTVFVKRAVLTWACFKLYISRETVVHYITVCNERGSSRKLSMTLLLM